MSKLTLSVDGEVVARAKCHAKRRGVSVSQMVEAYLSADSTVIHEAVQLRCPDFEDAVTAAAARNANCDYILTRDPKGFRGSPVRPVTPEEALPLMMAR